MKIKQKLMILMCISALFMSACDNSSLKSKEEDTVATQATVAQETINLVDLTKDVFDENDLYNDWSKANSVEVVMSDGEITSDGTQEDGVTIEGTTITLTKGGNYAFSGACQDGEIIVDSEDAENVRIILNGLTLTNTKGSAIYIKNAAKAILTSASDTSNTLTDGTDYSGAEEGVNAAVYSQKDLTFNGKGLITVSGNYQDGITSNQDFKITAGTVNIISQDDGIVAAKGISIKNGSYNIQCGGVGLKTTSVNDGEGFIGIESGNYNITSGLDAFNATGAIYLVNGSFTAFTGGGSTVASTDASWGNFGDGEQTAKGLKAGAGIEIYGGSFNLDTADDGVYAGDSVEVKTGCLIISSGDDGIVAAQNIDVKGGSITVSKSYEGFEAASLNLVGGYIDITSANDGINAAGGNDTTVTEERAGKNGFDRAGNGEVTIEETCINIKADGDALDVAGNLTISSGSVRMRGSQESADSSVDCSGEYTLNGGVIYLAGNEDEMLLPSNGTEQNIVSLQYPEQQSEDSVICVKDSDGNLVTCFTPAASFSKVLISDSSLETKKKYTWYKATVNDSSAIAFGDVQEDAVTIGDKIAEFKVDKGITKVDSTGVIE